VKIILSKLTIHETPENMRKNGKVINPVVILKKEVRSSELNENENE
jgi:hypothetical protein